jgi:hypothetical protein
MKITQDVRDYAATLNAKEQKGSGAEGDQIPSSEIEKGMAQMSAKLKEMGSDVYLDADKVKESNRVCEAKASSLSQLVMPGLDPCICQKRKARRKPGFLQLLYTTCNSLILKHFFHTMLET